MKFGNHNFTKKINADIKELNMEIISKRTT